MIIDKSIIFNLTPEKRNEIIEKIIDKVSINQNNFNTYRQTKWKDREFVRSIILDYLKLLTVDRNVDIEEMQGIITEEEALDIIYKNYNFRNKPNPEKTSKIFEKLDEYMSLTDANILFKGFPKISTMSIEELEDKLKILIKYGYLKKMIENPKKMMVSTDSIELQFKYYNNMIKNGIEKRKLQEIPAFEIFSDRNRVEETYGEGGRE